MAPYPTLYLAPLTYEISVAFHDVIHELGTGFGESVCQNALAIVLRDKGLLVETSYPFRVPFRGRDIGVFEADMVVERLVIVEVKATSRIEDWAKAQLMNYLKCAGGGVGVLANFGRTPEFRRFIVGHPSISLPLVTKEAARQLSRWLKDQAKTLDENQTPQQPAQ
jgi:GxxExxY protein